MTTLKRWEALRELDKGGRLSHCGWGKKEFLERRDGKIILVSGGNIFSFYTDNFINRMEYADGWQIYEEPPKQPEIVVPGIL